uniref:Uncharacterized protein n=1 Tax=Oryza sativa subsp. japonica TaxID=39947 RepID=Q6Z551_ORYSJ|nr:hypothetical protein [Oryza sativa Japonica Group]
MGPGAVPPLLLRRRRIEEAATAAAPHLFIRRGREATVSQIQISGLHAVARAATALAAVELRPPRRGPSGDGIGLLPQDRVTIHGYSVFT